MLWPPHSTAAAPGTTRPAAGGRLQLGCNSSVSRSVCEGSAGGAACPPARHKVGAEEVLNKVGSSYSCQVEQFEVGAMLQCGAVLCWHKVHFFETAVHMAAVHMASVL